jgi:hypothetical protein
VQQYACWVIDNLALDASTRLLILDKGGVDFLRVVLAQHRDSPSETSAVFKYLALHQTNKK